MKKAGFLAAMTCTLALTSISVSPAHASEDQFASLEILDVERNSSSVSISWSPLEEATRYIAYEELGAERNLGRELSPIHQGKDSSLTITDLPPGQVTRVRIIAANDEDIIARALVRTSSKHPEGMDDGITWIANDSSFDAQIEETGEGGHGSPSRSLDFSEGEISTTKGKVSTEEDTIHITDDNYEGEEQVYRIDHSPNKDSASPSRQKSEEAAPDPGQEWHISVPDMGENGEGSIEEEKATVQSALAYGIYRSRLNWDSFINEQLVDAPSICSEVSRDGDYYFNGNDRDFGVTGRSDNSKVFLSGQADFNIAMWGGEWDPEEGWEFLGWDDPQTSTHEAVGPTYLYKENDDGSLELVDEAQQSLESVTASAGLESSTTANIQFGAESANPLCTFLGDEAPPIRLDIEATISSDGSHSISGSHTEAPSHQSWVMSVTGPLTGETLDEPPDYFESQAAYFENISNECVYRYANQGFERLGFPVVGLDPDPEPFNPDCTSIR